MNVIGNVMTSFAGVLILVDLDNIIGRTIVFLFVPEIKDQLKMPIYKRNYLISTRWMKFLFLACFVATFMQIINQTMSEESDAGMEDESL